MVLGVLATGAASLATACSSHNEVVITITHDAAAVVPDVTTCTPSDAFLEEDSGLDLYMLMDRSDRFGDSDLNWLLFAFPQLLSAPEFRGINFGLGFYPESTPPDQECIDTFCPTVGTCGCFGRCGCDDPVNTPQTPDTPCRCDWWSSSCNAGDYRPFAEMAPLGPGTQLNKLGSTRIWAMGDPTLSAALAGSLRHRNEWEPQNPGHRLVQLVVAGSDFDDCGPDDDLDASEPILAGPDKPKTYIATYNEWDTEYDRLAVAGRTEAATRIRPQRDRPPAQELIELFQKIRDAEGRCEYLLREPLEKIDYRRVNLTSAAEGTVYPRVPNAGACALTPNGWYYDVPIANGPTRILTCPETCKSLHGTAGQTRATVNIQLGCPTIVSSSDGGT
ncbi:MAG: hypothetical protein ABW133_02800 [Polyangiaceae bacterium]